MSAHPRLGVLGGTFDPVHFGHFRAAESIREAMALDRILFVPSRLPPHKNRPGVTPAEHRYRMIQSAVEKEPGFESSRVEVDREGPSYTIDTLAVIKRSFPGTEVFFITGIDSFQDIRSWERWEELLRSYPFVVHTRPGYGLAGAWEAVPESMRSWLVPVSEGSPSPSAPAIYLVQTLTLDISSTEIRALVRAGRSIRYLVPREVENYITEHRLYREGA